MEKRYSSPPLSMGDISARTATPIPSAKQTERVVVEENHGDTSSSSRNQPRRIAIAYSTTRAMRPTVTVGSAYQSVQLRCPSMTGNCIEVPAMNRLQPCDPERLR